MDQELICFFQLDNRYGNKVLICSRADVRIKGESSTWHMKVWVKICRVPWGKRLTNEPPAGLEGNGRVRQWTLSLPYPQQRQRRDFISLSSLTKIAIPDGHSPNSHGGGF